MLDFSCHLSISVRTSTRTVFPQLLPWARPSLSLKFSLMGSLQEFSSHPISCFPPGNVTQPKAAPAWTPVGWAGGNKSKPQSALRVLHAPAPLVVNQPTLQMPAPPLQASAPERRAAGSSLAPLQPRASEPIRLTRRRRSSAQAPREAALVVGSGGSSARWTRVPTPPRAARLSIPPNSGARLPPGGLSLIGFPQSCRMEKQKRHARPPPPSPNRDRTHLCLPRSARRPRDPPRLLLPSPPLRSPLCAPRSLRRSPPALLKLQLPAPGMGRLGLWLGSARESWLLWAHTDLQVNEVGGSKERRTL